MKKSILLLLLALFFIACSNNEDSSKNPNIPNVAVSVELNLNFPLYSNLKSPSNAIYYSGANSGVRGIIVFNTGTGYKAYDAACPNQALSSCSTMTIKGINALCACDSREYLLFTGQVIGNDLPYYMKEYRVEDKGNILRIYN